MDEIIIGEYELIPNKIIVQLETGSDGFKKLNQSKLDQIQEIRYFNFKFYFIYNSDIADSFFNVTWGEDELRFELRDSLKFNFLDSRQKQYIRRFYIFRAILSLKEIAKDGTLIIEVGGR